jgi:hypothetical protein
MDGTESGFSFYPACPWIPLDNIPSEDETVTAAVDAIHHNMHNSLIECFAQFWQHLHPKQNFFIYNSQYISVVLRDHDDIPLSFLPPSSAEVIFFPINLTNKWHWVLAVAVCPKNILAGEKCMIWVCDSLTKHGVLPPAYQTALLTILGLFIKSSPETTKKYCEWVPVQVSRQNGNTCGMHTICNLAACWKAVDLQFGVKPPQYLFNSQKQMVDTSLKLVEWWVQSWKLHQQGQILMSWTPGKLCNTVLEKT